MVCFPLNLCFSVAIVASYSCRDVVLGQVQTYSFQVTPRRETKMEGSLTPKECDLLEPGLKLWRTKVNNAQITW